MKLGLKYSKNILYEISLSLNCLFQSFFINTASMSKNKKLSFQQKSVIIFMLKKGETPESIIEQWDVEIHKRDPPHIRTIYKMKRKIDRDESLEPMKTGPKTSSVLTVEKLMEVEEIIKRNSTATFRDISFLVNLPLSTTYVASKLLDFHNFEAVKEIKLTEYQMEQRLQFCKTLLCWNDKFKMMIWWSDESLFCLKEILHYKNTSYLAKENEYRIIEKNQNQKKINVWAAIRGNGKIIFEIQDGIQKSEKYIQLLINRFPEMELNNSFLMQDGAWIHTSHEAIDWLNWLWKDRWIGIKSSRLEFPPYSMDLTPMDFSFWSYLKRKVASKNIVSIEDLIKEIEIEIKSIPKEVIVKMCYEVTERCRKCIRYNGGRFENKP